uniref:Uncharacterized protein n=1 Tax=Avena sativa TaxID=4498 RepID=A0ACD5ZAH0_AVESA
MATTMTRHVVLFPFPAHGHLPGILAVARLIRHAFPEVTITLVCTERNVPALRASSSSSSSIVDDIHALPFAPSDHGLPADNESTSTLQVAQFITLFEAFESLEPAFDAFIAGLLAREGAGGGVCVVSDPTVAWTVDVAQRRGCAHALYLCCGAFGTAILHALWRNMPALPFGPDGLLHLPEHPEVVLHRSQLSSTFLEADGADRWTAYQHRRMQHAYRTDAVIINTVEELDPTGLAMVRRALGDIVPVFPVGPLVRDSDEETHDVLGWLDTQQPASVLYISFGSQNALRPKQMAELADTLESTGRPFVWAVRLAGAGAPPLEEWTGFEERARAQNRGLVLRGWAPQVSILAHGSTGGFLSHYGWNSVLESLTRGVPILGWPVSAEQFYNATMLEEVWGVCVEVARGNQVDSPAVESSKLGRAVEAVMGDTAMRRRVVEVQELLKGAWAEDGGSSTAALHGFFKAMRLITTTS